MNQNTKMLTKTQARELHTLWTKEYGLVENLGVGVSGQFMRRGLIRVHRGGLVTLTERGKKVSRTLYGQL